MPRSTLYSPKRRRNLPNIAAYIIGNMVGESKVIALIFSPYGETGLPLRLIHKPAITAIVSCADVLVTMQLLPYRRRRRDRTSASHLQRRAQHNAIQMPVSWLVTFLQRHFSLAEKETLYPSDLGARQVICMIMSLFLRHL